MMAPPYQSGARQGQPPAHGGPTRHPPSSGPGRRAAHLAWRGCGAAALSARPDLTPPGNVVAAVIGAARRFDRLVGPGTRRHPFESLLAQRARLSPSLPMPVWGANLRGTARLWRLRDGWLALNLPRPSDVEALTALTLGDVSAFSLPLLRDWFAGQDGTPVLDRARDLGLAAALVPPGQPPQVQVEPWVFARTGAAPRRTERPRVVDFSGLWAGPLATRLLADAGCEVWSVDLRSRQARASLPLDHRFESHLAEGKRRLVCDTLDAPDLRAALGAADIVVTASRWAALQRMGLDLRPDQIHLCLTAYGSDPANAARIGFGDDAAAAAGAVLWDDDGTPGFAADALGDPVAGMLGAVAVLHHLHAAEGGRIDLSLERACRWAIGPDPLAGLGQP